MQNEEGTHNTISTYPSEFTIESMERMRRVLGKDFAISGDAKLRMKFKMLPKAQQKLILNSHYGKTVIRK